MLSLRKPVRNVWLGEAYNKSQIFIGNHMQLTELTIENFRNFSNIKIGISNKNLIFGMNDVGKSNMIHALRMLFDSRIRNQDILETDFHCYKTTKPIIIGCCFGINNDDNDTQKLRASAGAAIDQDSSDFHVQLKIERDLHGDTIIELYWGSAIGTLIPIPSRGVNRTVFDDLFHCVYIPSNIELERTFSELKRELLGDSEKNWGQQDNDKLTEINELTTKINESIKLLPSVTAIQKSINTSLKVFDDQYEVEVASEQSVGGIHTHLALYTKNTGDTEPKLYPTSGDGRKKKLMYAMIMHLLTQSSDIQRQRKIPLLLIEEPENHLFLSAQVDLSLALFGEASPLSYVFLVTHSPQLFYRISQNAQLIRLYSESHQTTSKSTAVQLSEVYGNMKQKLMENLAHCLFVDRVLLVEGPSEKLLFDYLLDQKLQNNQNLRQRIYVMHVMGAHFLDYWNILHDIGILVMVKTDNDLKNNNNNTFSYLGINRCVDLFNACLDRNQVPEAKRNSVSNTQIDTAKTQIYQANHAFIEKIGACNIYLSEIDLEHDLASTLNKDQKWTDNLQKKKWHNMYELITQDEFSSEVDKIFASPQFKCLAEIIRDN